MDIILVACCHDILLGVIDLLCLFFVRKATRIDKEPTDINIRCCICAQRHLTNIFIVKRRKRIIDDTRERSRTNIVSRSSKCIKLLLIVLDIEIQIIVLHGALKCLNLELIETELLAIDFNISTSHSGINQVTIFIAVFCGKRHIRDSCFCTFQCIIQEDMGTREGVCVLRRMTSLNTDSTTRSIEIADRNILLSLEAFFIDADSRQCCIQFTTSIHHVLDSFSRDECCIDTMSCCCMFCQRETVYFCFLQDTVLERCTTYTYDIGFEHTRTNKITAGHLIDRTIFRAANIRYGLDDIFCMFRQDIRNRTLQSCFYFIILIEF